MIAQASRVGMGVGRFSCPLRGVGVVVMPDAGLHTMRHVESVCKVLLGASVLRVLVPDVTVGVLIDYHCVVLATVPTC
jgi:hypothetical protein